MIKIYSNEQSVLMKIIDEISAVNIESSDYKNERNNINYEKHSLYSNKPVKNINHLISDTFYTTEYINTLKNTLGNYDDFSKLSNYEKNLIQSSIESLSHDDYILKTYLHKSVHESKNLYKLFPESFNIFKENMNELLDGRSIYRGEKRTIKYKFKIFYEKILSLLLEKNYQLRFASTLSNSDVDIIFEDYLTPGVIYDMFCVILLKAARATLLNKPNNKFNSVNMSVLHHQVIYRIYRHMVISSIAHGITHIVISTKVVLPIDSLIRSIRNFILHEHATISATIEYKLFIDGIESLFKCFSESGLFVDITKEYVNDNKHIRYYFPTELSENLGKYTTPPRVNKQVTVTHNNILEFIIPTNFGKMELSPSTDFIKSINISNKKKFSINKNFFEILNQLEVNNHLSINYPISSKILIDDIYIKSLNNNIKFDKFASHVIDLIQTEAAKIWKTIEFKHQYRYLVNQTKAECAAIMEKQVYENKFNELVVERKGGLTRLILADIYMNFPLYYTNNICSTTRVFAKEYILSRHIGCLKLLRNEYSLQHVSNKGIIHMMKAYYSEDIQILELFETYLINISDKLTKKDLQYFYDNNRINYVNKKSVSHFMLISVELKQVFEISKTKLLLQLDQVASGLVFISIIFKNVELAKKTHIINDVYSGGPYLYAMTKFKSFYDRKIIFKNDKVIEFVCSSKKLHKYALMCYSYNQTVYGRTNDFVNLWREVYNSKPTKSEWKCLQTISTNYIKFIDELFPGIDTQFKILDKIVELVVKNVGYLKIRTIDGSVIIWKFYKSKRNIRKSFNPHNMVPENYALYTSMSDEKGFPLIDIKQYKVKFRSHLIHSIDAGVMRKIINRMHDDFNYEVDQLHDCVLLHPEKVDYFYTVVEKIYKDEYFHNYMNTHVFNEFRSIITSENFKAFDKLVENFNSHMSNTFEINGDFKKIYKPEV